jgi:hypothetical protein
MSQNKPARGFLTDFSRMASYTSNSSNVKGKMHNLNIARRYPPYYSFNIIFEGF